MSGRTIGWYLGRWAALGGPLFVVLVIASIFALGTPDSAAPSQEWAAYFADEGNRAQTMASMFLLALGGLAFLWFAWGLHGRLTEADPESERVSSLAFASALVFVAMTLIAAAAMGAVAGAITFGDAPAPSEVAGGELARTIEQFGFALFLIPGMLAASAMVALVSASAWHGHVFPRWLSGFGFVAAIALLFSALFLPIVALAIWAIAVGVYELTHGQTLARTASSGPLPAGHAHA